MVSKPPVLAGFPPELAGIRRPGFWWQKSNSSTPFQTLISRSKYPIQLQIVCSSRKSWMLPVAAISSSTSATSQSSSSLATNPRVQSNSTSAAKPRVQSNSTSTENRGWVNRLHTSSRIRCFEGISLSSSSITREGVVKEEITIDSGLSSSSITREGVAMEEITVDSFPVLGRPGLSSFSRVEVTRVSVLFSRAEFTRVSVSFSRAEFTRVSVLKWENSSSLSWVRWIFPKSTLAHQLGSGVKGLGLGVVGLDWSTASASLGTPLASPWFATVNVAVGYVMFIIVPIAYWLNLQPSVQQSTSAVRHRLFRYVRHRLFHCVRLYTPVLHTDIVYQKTGKFKIGSVPYYDARSSLS